MKKVIRYAVITLLFFTGINALIAGALFVLDPSGHKMGMSVAYLQYSPFQTFLIPGIILFIVNGCLNIAAAVAVVRKTGKSGRFAVIQGVLLGGWIVVQVILVRDINPLHIIMFSIGLLLTLGGWYLHSSHST